MDILPSYTGLGAMILTRPTSELGFATNGLHWPWTEGAPTLFYCAQIVLHRQEERDGIARKVQ